MRSNGCSPLLDDRFLLLESLGHGGMGRVYRAFDRAEQRSVALKVVPPPEPIGPDHVIAEEYDAWSRLRHPNIVRAYEIATARSGPIAPGTPYLVLEHFAGLPVHRVLRPGRTEPATLEEFARRVLLALGHVHDQGLVHRDLKPGNVLVGVARRGPGRVKLTDFGLATSSGRAGVPGVVSGSLPFVAPESFVGFPVDGRTDLYGLGILLFYLATGRMPVRSGDPEDVVRWHLQGPPADPRSVDPGAPERLSRFVRRMTARYPDERPSGVSEAIGLLGGPRRPVARRRPDPAGRSELAALRLALDGVRRGELRALDLPASRRRSTSLAREAEFLSRVHGLAFLRLRPGRRRATSNLGRLVLRLLIDAGGDARALASRHGLRRALPLDLVGALPVWDRSRESAGPSAMSPATLSTSARGIAAFVLAVAARRPLVILAAEGAAGDPLARAVIRSLVREAETAGRKRRSRGGLLVLVARPGARAAPTEPPLLHPRAAGP